MNKHKNKPKSFPAIEEALKKEQIKVAGTTIPLLTAATKHITISCFNGAIVDIKPTLMVK